jgi:hypothetical protein
MKASTPTQSIFVVTLACAILLGCPPKPNPPNASGDLCFDACKTLEWLECSVGSDPKCVETCKRVQEERITNLNPACLASARTQEEARKCGSVRCD